MKMIDSNFDVTSQLPVSSKTTHAPSSWMGDATAVAARQRKTAVALGQLGILQLSDVAYKSC